MRIARLVILGVFCVVATESARAQPSQVWADFQPVEQIVEDSERLRGSLRRVEIGIGNQTGQGSFVFRRNDLEYRDKLYFIAPGVFAEYDRSEYQMIEVDRDDFRIFQIIAPNTVFHIGLPTSDRQPLYAPTAINIDRRVRGDTERLPATDPQPSMRSREWTNYRSFKADQHRSVAGVLDRISTDG